MASGIIHLKRYNKLKKDAKRERERKRVSYIRLVGRV
jgi:hypothetical protein